MIHAPAGRDGASAWTPIVVGARWCGRLSVAGAPGENRSGLMPGAARQAAEDALLDRVRFRLDADRLEAFVALLEAPPSPNEELSRLLSTPAPWEERPATGSAVVPAGFGKGFLQPPSR